MFKKSLILAALLVPAVALSSAANAQAYQGGPRGVLVVKTQPVDNKPYAQFVPNTRGVSHQHIYNGGPKASAPHGR
jgi:hypothetical protein